MIGAVRVLPPEMDKGIALALRVAVLLQVAQSRAMAAADFEASGQVMSAEANMDLAVMAARQAAKLVEESRADQS